MSYIKNKLSQKKSCHFVTQVIYALYFGIVANP